ncbi:MAG: mannosyltransferase [Candidatus Tokpelaia sp. JSC085]|nr:MAG: mannosyltransferase [Candidatus Tokpelaia sp. JSC085]
MRVSLKETDIIAPNFKKRFSGVTATIIQLIPYQRAHGIRITALGPYLPNDLPSLAWSALGGLWKRPLNNPFRLWHARRNVEMIVGIFMRDVLHMKLRLIFTSASQRYHQPFTKWLIRRMDRVIATSKHSGSYLEVPHQVIMHGIDLNRFTPPLTQEDTFKFSGLPGKYAVGCFGRIRYQKGTDLFVDAMIELLPHYPEWTAIIAGRITLRHTVFARKLKDKISDAKLANRIIFIGELSDPCQWYRRLSLYVAPSRNEGFGLTPLEAMASQTAVVTSDAGAYAECVARGTGTVVPASNQPVLQKAIEFYMANPVQTITTGQTALNHVRSAFPLIREATAIGAVYHDLWVKAGNHDNFRKKDINFLDPID